MVWVPEAVGVIKGYPTTQAIFDEKQRIMRQQIRLYNAEGITFRSGVPDGWRGKKKLINQIKAAAAAEARQVVEDLKKLGHWVPDNVESEVLLGETMTIILAEKHTPENEPVPLYPVKERLSAIKMAWEMVQKKPVTQQQMAVTKAEDFLAALANKS